ncbi:MAG TPA: metallopeptidase TldD-related protein, partial [Bdellovibrionales bacterium]|nr:metallopeptidase TldD-related protein [Bdellovibrionales bacterium]
IVRNGRIEEQVKGASLIGTGIETLGRIVKVGQDLRLAAGTCGSVSGHIPVTVGQPPLLVSKLTVGGKA